MSPGTRRTVAIVAAAAVGITIVVVVVTVGLIPLPDIPSLAEQPDPPVPARIAFLQGGDGREEPRCLWIVDGSDTREVTCLDGYAQVVGWTDDGRVEVTRLDRGPATVLEVDPTSGEIVQRRRRDDEAPMPPWPSPRERADGTLLETAGSDGHVALVAAPRTGRSRVLLALDGPRDYRLDNPTWSPDGEWAAVVDSAGRLIVLRVTGDPQPRIVADDVTGYAWQQTVAAP